MASRPWCSRIAVLVTDLTGRLPVALGRAFGALAPAAWRGPAWEKTHMAFRYTPAGGVPCPSM